MLLRWEHALSILRDLETEFTQENRGAGGSDVCHAMAAISGKEGNSSRRCESAVVRNYYFQQPYALVGLSIRALNEKSSCHWCLQI